MFFGLDKNEMYCKLNDNYEFTLFIAIIMEFAGNGDGSCSKFKLGIDPHKSAKAVKPRAVDIRCRKK